MALHNRDPFDYDPQTTVLSHTQARHSGLETNEILRSVHFHKITNMLRPKVIIVDARDLTGCMSGIWRATETIERTFPLDTYHAFTEYNKFPVQIMATF